jgi:hypothetical protein
METRSVFIGLRISEREASQLVDIIEALEKPRIDGVPVTQSDALRYCLSRTWKELVPQPAYDGPTFEAV